LRDFDIHKSYTVTACSTISESCLS